MLSDAVGKLAAASQAEPFQRSQVEVELQFPVALDRKGGMMYDSDSSGAKVELLSYDLGSRLPVPELGLTIMAIAFPDTQPERSTTSWMIGDRSAVNCAPPRSLTAAQCGMAQSTEAVVSVRLEIL